MGKKAFATVGTTSFDALTQALDSVELVSALKIRGIDQLVVQIGRGEYVPHRLRWTLEGSGADNSSESGGGTAGFRCSYYRFKPDLARDICDADLVISHAGAGTVMECLRLKGKERRELVVVVNDKLMDNHQVEIAEALAERGVLNWTLPSKLVEHLGARSVEKPKTYPSPDVAAFSNMIDAEIYGVKRE